MENAAECLEQAFTSRYADGEGARDGRPLVGLFGDGLPEALIVAAGGAPTEVKAPPPGGDAAAVPDNVAAVIEKFVDPFTARFLQRFASGWYRGMAAIVFARDDVAALTAYQYATELRRQGMVDASGPRLFLWNLVHDQGDAAHRFNMVQAQRLLADLMALLGGVGDLSAALRSEVARRDAIGRMVSAGVAGRNALVWRNAGRWLSAERHASLLGAALTDAQPTPSGPRIGLVGTAAIDPGFHAMLDTIGPVVADLQPYGDLWPTCHAGGPDLDGLMRSAAGFPLHLRTAPPARFSKALLDDLEGCDIVVSQVDSSDDGFGWEVPALRDALAARGVPLVDLGFRPFDADADWLEAAHQKISDSMKVAA